MEKYLQNTETAAFLAELRSFYTIISYRISEICLRYTPDYRFNLGKYPAPFRLADTEVDDESLTEFYRLCAKAYQQSVTKVLELTHREEDLISQVMEIITVTQTLQAHLEIVRDTSARIYQGEILNATQVTAVFDLLIKSKEFWQDLGLTNEYTQIFAKTLHQLSIAINLNQGVRSLPYEIIYGINKKFIVSGDTPLPAYTLIVYHELLSALGNHPEVQSGIALWQLTEVKKSMRTALINKLHAKNTADPELPEYEETLKKYLRDLSHPKSEVILDQTEMVYQKINADLQEIAATEPTIQTAIKLINMSDVMDNTPFTSGYHICLAYHMHNIHLHEVARHLSSLNLADQQSVMAMLQQIFQQNAPQESEE